MRPIAAHAWDFPPGMGGAHDELLAHLLSLHFLAPSSEPGVLATVAGYRLLRILGVGGMGVVFLARPAPASLTAPAFVVVKVLKPFFLSRPPMQRRFLQEAVRLSRLSHPNLLPVLEVSPKAGSALTPSFVLASLVPGRSPVFRSPPPFFVTPYIAAGSLVDWLGRQGPFPFHVFLRVAIQLAGALNYLHSAGLVHRDVKPANVLVDVREHVFLADLGLATNVTETLVSDGQARPLVGTPAYLSPALAAGEAEDTRCDIYAFGAVCYELLSGRAPYLGETPQAVLTQVLAGPPPALAALLPALPAAMVRVVEGAMARQVRGRYSSMADVLADLYALQRDGAVAGPAPAPSLPVSRY